MSAPVGGVNVRVCFVASSLPSVHDVVAGSQVGPVLHFTAVCSVFVSSVIVYSVPVSTFHWMPHPIDPSRLVYPNFTFSGRAYS